MSTRSAARPLIRLVALGFLLAVTLAAGEIAARLTRPPPRPLEPSHPVHFNREGFHDADHEVAKPAATYRALCLGDSFTFARGIPLRDSFCHRIGRHLEDGLRRDGRPETVEMVSFAREGLSTAREVALLEHYRALDKAPDVLVLGYVLNDPEDESDSAALHALREPTLVRHPRGALAVLVRHSALAARVFERVENTRRYRALKHYYRHLHDPAYPGWQKVRDSFARLAELTRASATHVVVAIFPLLDFPLGRRYPFRAIHARVAELARASGFDAIDLLPVLEPHAGPRLVLAPGIDPHPSAQAHHLVAEAIAGEITRAGWLAAPPTPSPAPQPSGEP